MSRILRAASAAQADTALAASLAAGTASEAVFLLHQAHATATLEGAAKAGRNSFGISTVRSSSVRGKS